MSDFFSKLRQEIAETQKRRQRLDLLKIGFVSALLGFGSVKIQDIISFYRMLYIVPLVAVFFDMLIMGEHFSIKRIGAFLRIKSPENIEKEYETYVATNRDKFFKYGSRGFTVLSFIAAYYILTVYQGDSSLKDNINNVIWFLGLFIFYIVVLIVGYFQHIGLDKRTKI